MKKNFNSKNMMKAYEDICRLKQIAKANRSVTPDDTATQHIKEAEEKFKSASEKLTDEIKAAEGRSTARLLTARDVCSTIKEVEDRLELTKKELEGCWFIADVNAQDFPRAYKYKPESTWFRADFEKGSWRITAIGRDRCTKLRLQIELTDTAQAAILYNMKFIKC